MLKVLLFDADGVLITNEYLTVNLERDYGIPQWLTLPFFENEYMECVVGEKNLRDVLPNVLSSWGWKKSLDEFFEYWFRSEDIPNHQLLNFIKKLRNDGLLCCLATNQPKERLNYMLSSMRFKDYFDRIYASSSFRVRKPDLLFFEKIIEDLVTIKKEEVLLWDDSRENIMSAKKFGINAELYTSFKDLKTTMNRYL